MTESPVINATLLQNWKPDLGFSGSVSAGIETGTDTTIDLGGSVTVAASLKHETLFERSQLVVRPDGEQPYMLASRRKGSSWSERLRLEGERQIEAVVVGVRFAYWNLGRTTQADSVHGRLEQLRNGMTPPERVEHDWMGALMDGDTSLASRSAEAMFQIDPTSKYGFAAGFTAVRLRRLNDVLERFNAVDLGLPCQSTWFPWWQYTASAYHLLGRYDEERSVAQRGFARFRTTPASTTLSFVPAQRPQGSAYLSSATSGIAVWRWRTSAGVTRLSR